jgi:hypothetical protein
MLSEARWFTDVLVGSARHNPKSLKRISGRYYVTYTGMSGPRSKSVRTVPTDVRARSKYVRIPRVEHRMINLIDGSRGDGGIDDR